MKNKLLIIFTLIVIILCPATVHAKSKKVSISSIEEFYTAIGHQMLNHNSQQFYVISSEELKQQITSGNVLDTPFYEHYNPNDPLASGCYSHFSIHDMRIAWFSDSKTLSVQMQFYVPKETMNEYHEEMRKLAQELRKENDYESVKAVHDYIITRVEYDHNSLGTNYTDIEGFRENRMVCQGYSMATYVLLSYMGIPVRIVTGLGGPEGDREPHAWNIVQVDGKWYNYDATWDDDCGVKVSYDYFLKGTRAFPHHTAEGVYASSAFTDMISDISYYTPEEIRRKTIMAIGAVISIIVIIVVTYLITKKRKSKLAYTTYNTPSVGVVLNDDFPKMDFDKPITPNPTPSIFDDYNDQNNSNNNYNYNSYNEYKEEKTTSSNKTSSLSLRIDN